MSYLRNKEIDFELLDPNSKIIQNITSIYETKKKEETQIIYLLLNTKKDIQDLKSAIKNDSGEFCKMYQETLDKRINDRKTLKEKYKKIFGEKNYKENFGEDDEETKKQETIEKN